MVDAEGDHSSEVRRVNLIYDLCELVSSSKQALGL